MATSRPGAWDVVRFPYAYEDLPEVVKERPAVVGPAVDGVAMVVLIKVTGHGPRPEYPGEVRLADWEEAGLSKPSTARCSKAYMVPEADLDGLPVLGTLTRRDAGAVLGGLLEAGKVELP